MNLIDRYVAEVGKHLPRKNRLDIEAELRSILEDMLEDRKQSGDTTPIEDMTAELLQEFGPPRKVAENYQTHPYLIGPRMFPTYTFVLKIVLAVVTLALSIVSIIAMVGADTASGEILSLLGEFAGNLFGGLAAAFAYVTLTFSVLERVLPDGDLEDLEDWTPEELTLEPDSDKVNIAGQIFSIVFTLAGLILLNFYPGIIGMGLNQSGEWKQMVTLSQAFFSLLPWINLAGILTVILNIVLLRQGTWQTVTRLAHIGSQIFTIAIAIALIRGPQLLIVSPAVAALDVAGDVITKMFSLLMPIILLIVIIVSTVEVAKAIRQMLRKNSASFMAKKDAQ
jgi:hypothetical protein